MPGQGLALNAKNLSKAFGATKALVDANFAVETGAAHALLGENGAGKSTTIKILSGILRPDGGEVWIRGHKVELHEPRDAHRHGLQTAFQELTLAPDLTVLENMVLAYEPTSVAGQLDHKKARNAVGAHFEALSLTDIDLRADVRDLSLNQRQRIEIARALFRDPRVLLLDEATSTLSGRDVDWLGDIVRMVKARGDTVVMITHKIAEVRAFCERVTVLRNGRDVGTFATDAVSDEEIVEMIIGRSLDATFPEKIPASTTAQAVLSVRNLATEQRLAKCSFDLHPGEILGVAGLQGMGQSELFSALFGATPTTGGSIEMEGLPVLFGSPRQAINAGVALVPEDRKTEGLFLELSGRENMAMPNLGAMTRWGMIDSDTESRSVAAAMQTVQVDGRALDLRAGAFSGGNQQKMVLAKWLLRPPRILLLFDPCRGVDVGTKHEIYILITKFASEGGAVLFYSSETPELVNLCHRVIVLYGGQVAEVLPSAGETISETSIMRATLGQRSARV
jgi:ribose transport system ATP-binding protein